MLVALLVQQQPPQFRARVEIAHIEVSVLDERGRPVTGLTAADFTLLENGQARPIVAFDEVILRPAGSSARPSTLHSNVRSNTASPDRRLVVIVLDSSIGNAGLWAMARARDVARMVVDRLSPDDLAAVAFTADSAAGQDFTDDRLRLKKAIDRLRAKISGDNANDATLLTLANVVSLLADAPDRRKFLVFVASGVRMDVNVLATPAAIGSPSTSQAQMTRYHHMLLGVFGAAREANVNVYTVDPYGIAVGPSGGDVRKLNREFLITVAHNTGAQAIVNTNAFAPGVDAIFEQNKSYYLLGFEPSHAARGSRIEVRTTRPGATVRAQGLLAPPVPAKADGPGDALDSLLPRREIPLTGSATATGLQDTKDSEIQVTLRIGEAWVARFGGATAVDVVANAYDTNGTRRASLRKTFEGAALHQDLKFQFQLRPARYQVRIAVQSTETGAIGTLYLDVDRAR